MKFCFNLKEDISHFQDLVAAVKKSIEKVDWLNLFFYVFQLESRFYVTFISYVRVGESRNNKIEER